jgi:molybdate transport system substrate-binding protein
VKRANPESSSVHRFWIPDRPRDYGPSGMTESSGRSLDEAQRNPGFAHVISDPGFRFAPSRLLANVALRGIVRRRLSRTATRAVHQGEVLMKSISIGFRAFVFAIAGILLLAGVASAAEVRVMISGGLAAAYKELVPEFERLTGNTIITAYGPSMGTTVNAIPVRLERGEPADVLIMVGYALGDFIKQGKVVADSRVDLVTSPIGIAVKSGAPKPDISSAETVKRALLAAKSIAYSDSASGVYVSTEMFQKLGIADEMKDKARKIPATPVGEIVAHGDAELGFQQISELKPVPGIDIVGQLPPELQKITVFSAGIASVSKEPEAGKALIKFLASPAAAPVIIASGMEPIATASTVGAK